MAKDDKNQEPVPAKVAVAARGIPIKLVLIIGAGALLLGLIGTFAFLKLTSHEKPDVAQAATPPAEEAHGEAASKVAAGAIFDLEPFIVNLADTPEIRYLKLTMKLELDQPGLAADITARTPHVRDAILVLLSSKDSSAIRTTQGKFQLREELTQRVNAVLPKKAVRTVYFTEFVLQ
jgi:flagellar FliL protein